MCGFTSASQESYRNVEEIMAVRGIVVTYELCCPCGTSIYWNETGCEVLFRSTILAAARIVMAVFAMVPSTPAYEFGLGVSRLYQW
jgi:hypothetical protein